MGIAHRALPTYGCNVSVWDGEVTAEATREYILRLAADPNWPPGRLDLTDLRTVTEATIPDAQLVELLYEGTSLARDLKLAVVVNERYGTSDTFKRTAYGLGAVVLDDLGAACTYLDVPLQSMAATIADLRGELA